MLGRVYALQRGRVGVDNGRRLTERTVDWGHAGHVRVRGDDDGRGLGLEGAGRHVVLRLGLVVGVPLLHVRHLLRVAVGRAVVRVRVVVGRIRVVVDGRVCLRRRGVGVLVGHVHLLAALVVRPAGREVAWHHGRQAATLPRWRAPVVLTKRPACEATGERAGAWSGRERAMDGRRNGGGAGAQEEGEARRRW